MAVGTAALSRSFSVWRLLWQWAQRPAVARTLLIALAIGMWDLSSRLGLVDPFFISSPAGVVSAAGDLVQVPEVRHAFRVTGSAIAFAFVGGTLFGLAAGLAIGLSRLVRDAYFGTVLFVLGTPKSIFIPIFLLIFGTARTAAVFGAFEAFFYVVVNVVSGVDLVETRHRTVARAFRARSWHTFRDIILPAALPGIFAGLWYGVKHAFLGVIIVELYISVGGLGQMIRQYSDLLETDKVYAMIFGVSVVAIALGVAWTRVETRLVRWRVGADVVTTITTVP